MCTCTCRGLYFWISWTVDFDRKTLKCWRIGPNHEPPRTWQILKGVKPPSRCFETLLRGRPERESLNIRDSSLWGFSEFWSWATCPIQRWDFENFPRNFERTKKNWEGGKDHDNRTRISLTIGPLQVLKAMAEAFNLDVASFNKDLDIYRSLLSKMTSAKELMKEFLEREKKKQEERAAGKTGAEKESVKEV